MPKFKIYAGILELKYKETGEFPSEQDALFRAKKLAIKDYIKNYREYNMPWINDISRHTLKWGLGFFPNDKKISNAFWNYVNSVTRSAVTKIEDGENK